MNFLEKNLEDIIFETPNNLLRSRGLNVRGKKFRQVPMGAYGISDIISIHAGYTEYYGKFCIINILDLKKDKIDSSSFWQSVKYYRGIQHWLESSKYRDIDFELQITLIGREIDTSGSFSFISNVMPNINLVTYSYKFDGILFKYQSNFKFTNPVF